MIAVVVSKIDAFHGTTVFYLKKMTYMHYRSKMDDTARFKLLLIIR